MVVAAKMKEATRVEQEQAAVASESALAEAAAPRTSRAGTGTPKGGGAGAERTRTYVVPDDRTGNTMAASSYVLANGGDGEGEVPAR